MTVFDVGLDFRLSGYAMTEWRTTLETNDEDSLDHGQRFRMDIDDGTFPGVFDEFSDRTNENRVSRSIFENSIDERSARAKGLGN